MRIFVPSKGRADTCITPHLLQKEGLEFFLVLEPQDAIAYQSVPGNRLILDENDKGNGYVRRFIQDRIDEPWAWIIDDDIQSVVHMVKKQSYFDTLLQKVSFTDALTAMYTRLPPARTCCIAGPQYIQKGRAWTDKEFQWNRNLATFYALSSAAKVKYDPEFRVRADIRFVVENRLAGMTTMGFNHYLFRCANIGENPGGCSQFYDAGLAEHYLGRLSALYPNIVSTKLSATEKIRAKINWKELDAHAAAVRPS